MKHNRDPSLVLWARNTNVHTLRCQGYKAQTNLNKRLEVFFQKTPKISIFIAFFAFLITNTDLSGAQRWGAGSRFYGPQIRPPQKKQVLTPESITTTEYGAPLYFKNHVGPYSKYGWSWVNNPHYGYSFWHKSCGWIYSNQRKKWWNTYTNKWYARPMWSKKYYAINY